MVGFSAATLDGGDRSRAGSEQSNKITVLVTDTMKPALAPSTFSLRVHFWPDMVSQAYDPNTLEAKAGGLPKVCGQRGL